MFIIVGFIIDGCYQIKSLDDIYDTKIYILFDL